MAYIFMYSDTLKLIKNELYILLFSEVTGSQNWDLPCLMLYILEL
jgi:hypothetical protein